MKHPLVASEHIDDGKYHLLLAASGSVATIKIPNIAQALGQRDKLSIRIILTECASQFLGGQSDEQPRWQSLEQLPNVDAVYHDHDEWNIPWTRGAPILHIELRRWADALLVSPLSANTLSKVANGISDNLLTSVIRAWQVEPSNEGHSPNPIQRKIFLAPAMNTAMWRHPISKHHLRDMTDDGLLHWIEILPPIEKTLACGDTGDGAMCQWQEIVRRVENHIDLQGAVRNFAS